MHAYYTLTVFVVVRWWHKPSLHQETPGTSSLEQCLCGYWQLRQLYLHLCMKNSLTFVDTVAMLRRVLILFSYLIFLSPISSIYSAIPITVIPVRAFNLVMFLLHQWKYHRRTQGLKESTSEIWILLLNHPGRECHCTDCFTVSGADRNY